MFQKKALGFGVLAIVGSLLVGTYAFAATTSLLFPTTAGSLNAWTPSAGSTHYTLVDETGTCNGTTDYNSTTVVGNRDSYGVSLATVPDGAVITGIDIKPCASRVSGGGTNPVMNVFYRWNGTSSVDRGSYALTGTTPIEKATTTYAGLVLTKNASSTLEIGAVLTSGAKGARLSRILTKITYDTLPAAPSDLTATTTGTSTAVLLSWTDNANNEAYFTIERSVNSPGGFSFFATTTANVTTKTDASVSSGNTYYYRVLAANGAGNSAFSSSTSISIP